METNTSLERLRTGTSSAFSALERFVEAHAFGFLVCGFAIYCARALELMRERPLQWDEYLVYAQAHLPTFSAFWSNVVHTPGVADPPLHPLLMFLAVRSSLPLRLAMRLPSLIGYAMFLCSVFVVVRRRAPAAVALVAFAVPMLLPAFEYCCIARPYALLAGFGGCAFALWQQATEENGRRLETLVLLFVCLSGSVLSHYFGAAVFFPLIAGELWRTYQARRVDWGVWRTLAVAGCVVLTYVPFLHGAYRWRSHPYHGSILHQVLLQDLTATYGDQITPVLMILIMACILILVFRSSFRAQWAVDAAARLRFPSYEAVAIAVAYCIPLIVFAVATLTAGAYYSRYSILFILAITVLISTLVYLSTGVIRGLTTVIALGLLLESARAGLRLVKPGLAVRDEIDAASIQRLEQFAPNPIATPNWSECARLFVFGPPDIRSRLLLMFTGTDTQLALSRVLQIPMETPEEMVRRHRQFVLIEDYEIQEAIGKYGGRITFLGRAVDHDLALVETHTALGLR